MDEVIVIDGRIAKPEQNWNLYDYSGCAVLINCTAAGCKIFPVMWPLPSSIVNVDETIEPKINRPVVTDLKASPHRDYRCNPGSTANAR